MRSSTARFLVCAILVGCLALPPGLSAKSKRGAELVVTRLDGSQVSGELIAVKPDSLLLYLPFQGTEESVDKADIRSIRIRRRSGAGKGALYGGLGGLGTGIVLGATSGGIDEFSSGGAAAVLGFTMGIMGSLGGLIVGAIRGVDIDLTIAGQPEETVAEYYLRLQKHARVGTPNVSSPAVRKPPVLGPVGSAPPRAQRARRFRLSLPWIKIFSPGWRMGDSVEGAFHFPGDVPAGEAGPYPAVLSRSLTTSKRSGIGSVNLAYEWSRKWAAEIEVVFSSNRPGGSEFGTLSFTSLADGKIYEHEYYQLSYRTDFAAVLAGATYRPYAPSPLRRHVLEAGVGAGPAWAKLTDDTLPFPLTPAPQKRTVFTARAHLAYDFYITPALSLGAVAGYRYLRAEFAGSSVTDTLFFWEKTEVPLAGSSFERLTEVTVPLRKADAGGIFLGVRAGVRI